jgi:hypothetical protein
MITRLQDRLIPMVMVLIMLREHSICMVADEFKYEGRLG